MTKILGGDVQIEQNQRLELAALLNICFVTICLG
jgi:hypothetical protein